MAVTRRDELSPRMLRLGFEGGGLRDMAPPDPAGSVRLLVPSPGSSDLVVPTWTGNEFLLPDGSRPALRTFTPLRFDATAGRLDLEIVRHPGGVVSTWAESARPGDPAAISGPARGIAIDPDLRRIVLLADETALPAVTQLLDVLPDGCAVDAHIELLIADARIPVPWRKAGTVTWHVNEDGAPGHRLVDVARQLTDLGDHDHVWAAGEAASMQAIRKHLFQRLGLARAQATVRGYWKPARP